MKKLLKIIAFVSFFGLPLTSFAGIPASWTTATGTNAITPSAFSGVIPVATTNSLASTSVQQGYVLKANGNNTNSWAATSTLGLQGSISLTTTGSSGASTLIGNTLNIPQYTGGSGTNYFTNSSSNTFLNTGTNLQAPTFTATSTTGTSVINNVLTVDSSLNADGDINLGGSLISNSSDFFISPNTTSYVEGNGAANFGIGTNSPNEPLEVQGNSFITMALNGTTAARSAFLFEANGNAEYEFGIDRYFIGAHNFYIYNSNGGGTPLLLDSDNDQYSFGATDFGNGITFKADDTNRQALIGDVNGVANGTVFTVADGGGGSAYLNQGNFGIDNTSPGFALDVAGDANVTGCYRISGSCKTFNSGTVTSVATNGTLTGGTCTTTCTLGLNLANGNVWTASSTFTNFNANNSTTTNATTTNLAIRGLSNTFLAVNGTGQVVATTTPSGGSGTNYLTNSGANTFLNLGTNLQAPTFNATSTTGNSVFANTATFAGNIGVNTTGVTNPVTISGSDTSGNGMIYSNNNAFIGGTGTYLNSMNLLAPNLAATQNHSFNIGVANSTNNSAGFNFLYQGSGSASNAITYTFFGGNPIMTLLAGGAIGIGTGSPLSKLDVSGSEAIGSYAGIIAAPSNGLIVSGNAGFGSSTPSAQVSILAATNTKPFDIASSSLAQFFSVNANGRVGIGSSTPQAVLAVNDLGSSTLGTAAKTRILDVEGGGIAKDIILRAGTSGSFDPNPPGGNVLIAAGNGAFGSNTPGGTVTITGGDAQGAGAAAGAVIINAGAVTNSTPGYIIIATTTGNLVGIGSSTPTYKLSVSGTAGFTNVGTATGLDAFCRNATTGQVFDSGGLTCQLSSVFFKHDIEDMTDAETLHDIADLRAITYTSNDDKSKNVGFIAEEVQKIDPRLVDHAMTDETVDGHLFKKGDPVGVNYGNITAVLVKYDQDFGSPNSKSDSSKWPWIAIAILGIGFIYQQRKINKIK